jgi:PAS domain S-box-containing protein
MEAERARFEEEALLLLRAVRSLSVPIITKDLDGVITSWNPAAERLFGYSKAEAVGRHISMLIPPEKGIEETRILETISRGELVSEFETVRLRKDGSRVEVAVAVSPLLDSAGTIIGATKIAKELTACRQMQRDEEDRREQMAITLSSIADGIIVTDEQGYVTYLNPAAETLTGWKLADAKEQPLERVFHIINEQTRRRAENPLPRVLEHGTTVGLANHTLLVARDRTERAIDDSASPIRRTDGTISGAVLVFRDVSQHRDANEMRARLAAIVTSSDDAIISKDLRGRITSWNTGAQRLFGYSAEEMVGKHISLIIPPKNLKEETEILERISRGERIEHFETVRLSKAGRLVEVSLTVSPIRNAEGLVIGASKIARDIAEQRRIRVALEQAKVGLERVVAERTAQLQEALTDLEHFSYSMSHDLRAPLRNIRNFASLLLSEHAGVINEQAQNYVHRISASAARMDRLMSDALEYVRVAREEIELSPVDLDKVVQEVIAHSPQFQPDQSRIQVEKPLLRVRGSEALLVRSISNLLGNAVKFTEPGTSAKVKVWTTLHGNNVRVFVQDQGIGIPAGDMDRIWRIFERGHRYKQYEGTGVGLSLVKRAAERMGGSVGVESELGKGSTFWLELKAAPEPAAKSPLHVDGAECGDSSKESMRIA